MFKAFLKTSIIAFFMLILGIGSVLSYMMWMPDPEYAPDHNDINHEIELLETELKKHVRVLSEKTTGRNYINKDNLTPARNYIVDRFKSYGLDPAFHVYELDGDRFSNVIVNIPGTSGSEKVLVVGAHYDSVEGSPGANDNASGVGALLEIARYISMHPVAHNVRFIAFANEEPPYFQSEDMGSLVYANALPGDNDNIIGMISIETIGYYSDTPGSQKYPKLIDLFYPDTGNFVAFIGNMESRSLVRESISLFRKNSNVSSEGIAAPAFIPGVSWSDHWSFWKNGYEAIMVTDTAPFRYEHYHKVTDTPDKLNYREYSKVVYGLMKVVEGMANIQR